MQHAVRSSAVPEIVRSKYDNAFTYFSNASPILLPGCIDSTTILPTPPPQIGMLKASLPGDSSLAAPATMTTGDEDPYDKDDAIFGSPPVTPTGPIFGPNCDVITPAPAALGHPDSSWQLLTAGDATGNMSPDDVRHMLRGFVDDSSRALVALQQEQQHWWARTGDATGYTSGDASGDTSFSLHLASPKGGPKTTAPPLVKDERLCTPNDAGAGGFCGSDSLGGNSGGSCQEAAASGQTSTFQALGVCAAVKGAGAPGSARERIDTLVSFGEGCWLKWDRMMHSWITCFLLEHPQITQP